MTVLFDKVVTARKSHRCDQCFQQILPGERYRKQVHEDGLTRYKAHEDCDSCSNEMYARADLPYEYVTLANDAVADDKAWIKESYPAVYERLFVR